MSYLLYSCFMYIVVCLYSFSGEIERNGSGAAQWLQL